MIEKVVVWSLEVVFLDVVESCFNVFRCLCEVLVLWFKVFFVNDDFDLFDGLIFCLEWFGYEVILVINS